MRSILVIASFPDSLLLFRGELLSALLKRGIVVHVAAPDLSVDSPIRVMLEARGIKVHTIRLHRARMNPWLDILAIFDILRLLLLIRPEGVLAYTIKPVIYGLLAARFTLVPKRIALITGLGYAFSDRSLGGGVFLRCLVSWLYMLALRNTKHIFFQNPDDKSLFLDLGIIDCKNSVSILNGSGINVKYFMAVPPPSDAPSFLLIARLLGSKGVREFVAAAKIVKQAYPEAIFRLVGWIDENPDAITNDELQSWINTGVIDFLGRMSDVRPAIANCSVYVLPSYREGTPRTVLEAMAMGRPIITTDAPGCRETVVDGDNGFLVTVKAVDELVDAMKKFIVSPELVARMGKRSREIAEAKYDVSAVNAVMLREMGIAGEKQ